MTLQFKGNLDLCAAADSYLYSVREVKITFGSITNGLTIVRLVC